MSDKPNGIGSRLVNRTVVDDVRSRCDTACMSYVPTSVHQITFEWLHEVMNLGLYGMNAIGFSEMTGHNPDLSQLFRGQIKYHSRTDAHPDTIIVKIPPEDKLVRLREAAYGPYVGELGCYRLLAEFYGGPIARMFGAVENPAEKTVAFVFEDLGELPAGQKYARVDLQVAKLTLDFMGTYHARYWDDEELGRQPWIRDADWSFLFNQDPLDSTIGWQVIRDDDRFEKSGGLVVAGEYLGPRLNDLRVALRSRPNTLTHNDFHQGNVLLRQSPTGPTPVIIDWQLPAFAGGTNDLAKFMMTAVPFEILAENEHALVAHYVDVLKANGVTDYSVDECWRDYRRAQVMVFGNYAIGGIERSADGSVAHSSGDSTHAVIRALGLIDPGELNGFLP